MSIRTWQTELPRFRAMAQLGQLCWLSSLIFHLSVYARDTYEAGTDGVSRPGDLRRFNELIHRVATYQKKVSTSYVGGLPDDSLFRLLEDQLNNLGVNSQRLLESLP
jgi:hypothetical protein